MSSTQSAAFIRVKERILNLERGGRGRGGVVEIFVKLFFYVSFSVKFIGEVGGGGAKAL